MAKRAVSRVADGTRPRIIALDNRARRKTICRASFRPSVRSFVLSMTLWMPAAAAAGADACELQLMSAVAAQVGSPTVLPVQVGSPTCARALPHPSTGSRSSARDVTGCRGGYRCDVSA